MKRTASRSFRGSDSAGTTGFGKDGHNGRDVRNDMRYRILHGEGKNPLPVANSKSIAVTTSCYGSCCAGAGSAGAAPSTPEQGSIRWQASP